MAFRKRFKKRRFNRRRKFSSRGRVARPMRVGWRM